MMNAKLSMNETHSLKKKQKLRIRKFFNETFAREIEESKFIFKKLKFQVQPLAKVFTFTFVYRKKGIK